MNTRQTLRQVAVGMIVYDSGGARIGTVSAIHPGKATKTMGKSNDAPIVEIIAELVDKRRDLSVHLCLKLYNEGFIYVEGPSLQQDLIISPSDIEEIDTDCIYLNIQLVYRKKLKLSQSDADVVRSHTTKTVARTS